jgi:hypothetical protein
MPLLSMFIQDTNGVYVPRVYGHVDPNPLTCMFITETGEKHKIYRIGDVYMFGRVYVLDTQNTGLINGNREHRELCSQSTMERLEDPHSIGPNLTMEEVGFAKLRFSLRQVASTSSILQALSITRF